jgi:peptidoglycan/LPS O-acetylase OafA/YrhL
VALEDHKSQITSGLIAIVLAAFAVFTAQGVQLPHGIEVWALAITVGLAGLLAPSITEIRNRWASTISVVLSTATAVLAVVFADQHINPDLKTGVEALLAALSAFLIPSSMHPTRV